MGIILIRYRDHSLLDQIIIDITFTIKTMINDLLQRLVIMYNLFLIREVTHLVIMSRRRNNTFALVLMLHRS